MFITVIVNFVTVYLFIDILDLEAYFLSEPIIKLLLFLRPYRSD